MLALTFLVTIYEILFSFKEDLELGCELPLFCHREPSRHLLYSLVIKCYTPSCSLLVLSLPSASTCLLFQKIIFPQIHLFLMLSCLCRRIVPLTGALTDKPTVPPAYETIVLAQPQNLGVPQFGQSLGLTFFTRLL